MSQKGNISRYTIAGKVSWAKRLVKQERLGKGGQKAGSQLQRNLKNK